jgi:hypothetical protein
MRNNITQDWQGIETIREVEIRGEIGKRIEETSKGQDVLSSNSQVIITSRLVTQTVPIFCISSFQVPGEVRGPQCRLLVYYLLSVVCLVCGAGTGQV